jgi:hypothetical protein
VSRPECFRLERQFAGRGLPPAGSARLCKAHKIILREASLLSPPPRCSTPLCASYAPNASIAAYHDPCVPKPDSSPYFASVPVMNDDVSVNLGGGAVTTKGINVAVEDSKVVEVQLLSDGPTPGPWTMAASVFPGEGVDGGALTFEFDSKMGQNGDVRHLTVTPHQPGNIPFMVTSTLGTKQTYWLGLVGQ